jgi:dynein heavy chain 1
MQWDHLVNAYDGHRYLPGAATDGRESRHVVFVREFASVVSLLQDKATALIDELGTCDFTTETFSRLLGQIQKTVSRD